MSDAGLAHLKIFDTDYGEFVPEKLAVGGIAARFFKNRSERQSLSAHYAAEPQDPRFERL